MPYAVDVCGRCAFAIVKSISLTIALATCVGGCASAPKENLPVYPWAGTRAALQMLCERSRAVTSASSRADITLTRPDGQSVRLDAAVVMRPPGYMRMRAWKFGQRVFDLTLTPAGLWVEGPQDPGRRQQALPASLSAARVARAWTLVTGEFFCGSDASAQAAGGSRFRVERTIEGQRVTCDVDRSTLTPRQYRLIDPNGVTRFSLDLNQYQIIGGIVWPVHLTATSDAGRISIELHDVELNGELAPQAFVPPPAARRMP